MSHDEHRLGGEMRFGARVLYSFVRGFAAVVARLYLRMSMEGTEHLPANGPFILSPVHRSNLDTPLVGPVTKRRMRYMGKDSMWKYGASAWFFTTMGGFPVHRGSADRQALRACQAVIERGEPLVMFPEGTRQEGPVVEHLYDGPAYVACRTGAPIIPVGLGGTARAWPKGAKLMRPTKVTIVIGEPIEPPPLPADGARLPRRVVHELTEELKGRLQVLFDEAQRQAGAA
jgi:1-acyl-sn-glycerol-3-phosphate acyltransferase